MLQNKGKLQDNLQMQQPSPSSKAEAKPRKEFVNGVNGKDDTD
jgi:hypothetical protein